MSPDQDAAVGAPAAVGAATVLLVASLAGAVVIADWQDGGPAVGQQRVDAPVAPVENGTDLWPYTSRSRSVEGRTLGINLIVVGPTDAVRRVMLDRSDFEWNGTANGTAAADANGSVRRANEVADDVDWGGARGAKRYTRVTVDGETRWMDESYQLHAGSYLGQRLHVRAYEDPNGEWTAMQTHTEHWDWFRLRHTVTGIADAREEVERDFMGEPYVDSVSRRFYGNPTADGDGWVTRIRMALLVAPLLGLAAVARLQDAVRLVSRVTGEHGHAAALGGLLFGLYVGVRLAGIGLEAALPGLSPKLIAAPLYLLLASGIPALAYVVGRDADPVWGGTYAVVGLGSAFLVDFVLMGVDVVPIRFALHRLAVLLAVALVATGASRTVTGDDRAPLTVGLVGWLLALGLPLFGYI